MIAPLRTTSGRMSGKAVVAALVWRKGKRGMITFVRRDWKLEVEADEVDEVFVWMRGKKRRRVRAKKKGERRGGKKVGQVGEKTARQR